MLEVFSYLDTIVTKKIEQTPSFMVSIVIIMISGAYAAITNYITSLKNAFFGMPIVITSTSTLSLLVFDA